MKPALTFACLFLSLPAALATAAETPVIETVALSAGDAIELRQYTDIMRDGDGRVWALAYHEGSYTLFRLEADSWQIMLADTQPCTSEHRRLRQSPDGAVLCGSFLVRGGRAWKVSMPRITTPEKLYFYSDSLDQGWISLFPLEALMPFTENPAPDIAFPVEMQNRTEQSAMIHAMDLLMESGRTYFKPVFTDTSGRFWSVISDAAILEALHLKPVLCVDPYYKAGKSYENPDRRWRDEFFPYTILDRAGKVQGGETVDFQGYQHLLEGLAFLPAGKDGFYFINGSCGVWRIDAATLQGEPVLPGSESGFQIFHFIPSEKGFVAVTPDGLIRKTEAGWIPGGAIDGRKVMAAWCEAGDAIWLAGRESPLWRIPLGEGDPVPIGWEQGFSLPVVRDLILLDDGRILAGDPENGFAFIHPGEYAGGAGLPRDDRIGEFACRYPVLQDTEDVLYFMQYNDTRTLWWRDAEWHETPLPSEVMPYGIHALDDQNRLWIFSHEDPETRSCAVYNRKGDAWQVFPGWLDVLSTEEYRPLRLVSGSAQYLNPASNESGQAGFAGIGQVYYFDGTAWLRWKKKEITGNSYQIQACFFDDNGQFCLRQRKDIFSLKGNSWQRKTDPDPAPAQAQAGGAVPECLKALNAESALKEGGDQYWMTREGALWHVRENTALPVTASDVKTPFHDGRSIRAFWRDSGGTLFFHTGSPGTYGNLIDMVRVTPPAHPPETGRPESRLEGNTLTLSMPHGSAPAHIWRFKEGPWQPPVAGGDIVISGLADGDHLIEVAAMNAWFERDPDPEAVRVTVAYMEENLQGLLDGLASEEYDDRQKAARELIELGRQAIPALEAAAASTEEDTLRWWIDVVIQQIESAGEEFHENSDKP